MKIVANKLHSWIFKIATTFVICLFSMQIGFAQNSVIEGIVREKKTNKSLEEVTVQLNNDIFQTTTKDGKFKFAKLVAGSYTFSFFSMNYNTIYKTVILKENETIQLEIELSDLEVDLNIMEVSADVDANLGLTRLKNVEGFGINGVRKTEVIQFRNLVANFATNRF